MGWIKIDRSIQEHWIYQDAIKLKWWIDMLLSVNHTENRVNIGNKLYKCDRGQSIMSLQTWAEKWQVSKDKVRNFFTLLENDNMILRENLGKTTRITICNYATYQDVSNDNSPQSKRNPNDNSMGHTTQTHRNPNDNSPQSHANKNDKNEKNIIKNRVLTNSTKSESELENEVLKKEIDVVKTEEKKSNFQKPTMEEIQNFINEQNLIFDAEEFYYHYEGNGWSIGKTKMKDWKATARNWSRRKQNELQTKQASKKQTNINIEDLWQQ